MELPRSHPIFHSYQRLFGFLCIARRRLLGWRRTCDRPRGRFLRRLDNVSDCWTFQRRARNPRMVIETVKISLLGRFATSCQRAAKSLAALAIAAGLFGGMNSAATMEAPLWDALRSGGHIVLLRHAVAPGTGDPAGLTLGDCSTQRNLSERGRAQAARIGKRFRENGIKAARVYSSQWCRCLHTAKLLTLGPVNELPALNSLYQRWDNRVPQTNALRTWLRQQDLSEPYVLVTHQVNITGLTGVSPRSGELVIVQFSKAGEFTVIGTIETD